MVDAKPFTSGFIPRRATLGSPEGVTVCGVTLPEQFDRGVTKMLDRLALEVVPVKWLPRRRITVHDVKAGALWQVDRWRDPVNGVVIRHAH